MRASLILALFCVCSAASKIARDQQQDSSGRGLFGIPGAHAGLFAGYTVNWHAADFAELPGVPNCCPRFESGSGGGIYGGALMMVPVNSFWSIALRAGYFESSGTLSQRDIIGGALRNGQTVDALVEHSLEASLGALALEPQAVMRPFDFPLSGNVGLHFGYRLTSQFEQREVLLEPLEAIFDNGTAIRNERSGALPDANRISLALTLGLAYEVPLSSDATLAPEVHYSYDFAPVVSDLDWSVHSLRLGLALHFHRPQGPTAAEDASPEQSVPALDPPQLPEEPIAAASPLLQASLAVQGVFGDGAVDNHPVITIDESDIGEYFPLLLYVFFDRGSDDLARSRQLALRPQAVAEFREDLLDPATMTIYANMLNIVGSRLRANPTATITLIGRSSGSQANEANRRLARRRAEGVQAYLNEIWRIDPARMPIRVEDQNMSDPGLDSDDAREEIRRVEIESASYEIVKPVHLRSGLQQVTPSAVEITPAVRSTAGLAEWTLNVQSAEAAHVSYLGGAETHSLRWEIDASALSDADSVVAVTLDVRDLDGRSAAAEVDIPVVFRTRTDLRSDVTGTFRREKFSLILFGYDSDLISRQNTRILDLVRSRIQGNSLVSIVGYADRTGEPVYNKDLARRRCENVRRILLDKGVPARNISVHAVGSDVLLHDNELPEGRNYSRTVQIIVATPVSE